MSPLSLSISLSCPLSVRFVVAAVFAVGLSVPQAPPLSAEDTADDTTAEQIAPDLWHGFAISERTEKEAILSSDIGTITVALPLPDLSGDALQHLIRQAEAVPDAAQLSWTLQMSPFTGPRLASGPWMILPEAVLRSHSVENRNSTAERQAITSAVQEIVATLDDDAPNANRELHKILRHELPKLAALEDVTAIGDEVGPNHARLLLTAADGWLASALPSKHLQQLRDVVATANTWRPNLQWQQWQDGNFVADGAVVERLQTAFNKTVWRLQSSQRQVWQYAPAAPLYYGPFRDAIADGKVQLIAEVKPQAVLTELPEFPEQLRLVADGKSLLTWTESAGLIADETSWRSFFPAPTAKKLQAGYLSDNFPPHVVWGSPDGGMHQLILGSGVVSAPSAINSFIDEAARFATTPAQLDLVGQYFLRYVYDSPDPQLPNLPGNPAIRGDIHQTTAQTLATSVAGICRGDCDDLAELYQTITEQQGHLTHIIDLPQHAAAAYAEAIRSDDEDAAGFAVTVMQTGPTFAVQSANNSRSSAGSLSVF